MRRPSCVASVLIMLAGACGGGDEPAPDVALRVTVSGSAVVSLAAIEGGQPIAIGVSLDREPSEPITVVLSADPLVALDRITLTFTPADYDMPQPVVITAVDDADVVDGAGEIVLAASQVDELVLPIAVADDDTVAAAGLPAELVVMEGDTATFRVALAMDPGGPVTVTLAASDAGVATLTPATLSFAANWADRQTVTVSGVADADDADEELTIDVAGLHVSEAAVPVVVLDVDRQNMVTPPGALALTEGGPGGTFTVRLTQPPAGTLDVAVAVENPAIAVASPTTLSFTAADYAVPQVVTVSPQVDLDGVLDVSAVRLTSTGLRDRRMALSVAEDAVSDVPDLTGEYLMSISPAFAPEILVRYRVTYTIDGAAGTLGYSATALRVDNDQPVGDPIVASGVALDDAAGFAGPFSGVLPGAANPFSGTEQPMNATKLGSIVDADLLCGTMAGSISGIDLAGTTWGAVRISGPELPPAVVACP